MCSFQELYRGDDSYVIRCEACQHYQLLFGGIVLSMNQKEFDAFSRTVAGCRQNLLTCNQDCDMPVATMRQGVHLLLNQQKIGRLHYMLEAATMEATTQTLLKLFSV